MRYLDFANSGLDTTETPKPKDRFFIKYRSSVVGTITVFSKGSVAVVSNGMITSNSGEPATETNLF